MRLLSLTLFVLGLSACSAGSGGGSDPELRLVGGPGSGTPNPVSVVLKGGSDFECFSADYSGESSVWCRSLGSPDHRLGLVSSSFVEYVRDSNSSLTLEVWDDTICVSSSVLERPVSGFSGVATFCTGEASFGVNYSTYPLIYSPPFAPSDVPSDLTFAVLPFAGGDVTMDLMTDTGGTWLVMMDGSLSTSDQTLSCTETNGLLECGSFTVNLN